MFTRVYNNISYCGPRNITIQENKAPTDESIKLYQECLDKALKNIISNEHVNNNTLDYRVMIVPDIYLNLKMIIILLVNGKRYVQEEDISKYVTRKIVKKETLEGDIYELNYDYNQLKCIKYKMLGLLLLKCMNEISSENFAEISNFIQR